MNDLLFGFVSAPRDLIQAGWPLKLDLYRYTPMTRQLELYSKAGEVLGLERVMDLFLNPTVWILAERESLQRLRSAESTSTLDVGQDELLDEAA